MRASVWAGALTLLAVGAGTGVAGAAPAAPLPAYAPRDLGTLGGTTSEATGISGNTVVGNSFLKGDTSEHAFVYSLRTGHMTDIGTLGGDDSQAVAVRGVHVIGTSELPGGATHGFVYDLRTHHMTDLGTLGGTSSDATAISGENIVGTSSLAGDTTSHAFVYSLRTGHLTDLGTLTGSTGSSAGVDISGATVVGNSPVPDPAGGSTLHGFAVNLNTHHMTDVGTLGGTFARVYAVSGHTVVGQSRTGGGALDGFAYNVATHARTDLGPGLKVSPLVSGTTAVGGDSLLSFTYDLTTGATAMVGPGSGVTQAFGIDSHLVVGDVFAANAFAFVYRISDSAFTRLPALGGLNSTAAQANARGVVVGSAALPPPDPYTANGPFHAVAWLPRAQPVG
ncbi:hypothetical protein AB0M29_14955 [Streptomyces sp. NPDC051976]|uniref:hypothetical protein n=1 Tax=Streptomyces sp. NPDC051976 TaxID=3154947 RepID=UPI003412FC94